MVGLRGARALTIRCSRRAPQRIPPPPPGSQWKHRPRILVPGAGLGRMVWDSAACYDVVGVEVAITMNLVMTTFSAKFCPSSSRRGVALYHARRGEPGHPGVLGHSVPTTSAGARYLQPGDHSGSDVGTGPTGHVQIIQGDGNIVSTMEPVPRRGEEDLGSNAGSTRTPSTLPPYVGP